MRAFVVVLLVITAATAFAEEKAKPTAAAEGLALEVRLPATVESGQPLALTSAFVNRAKAPVSFFVPEHVDRDTFPRFVFMDAEGQRWEPYDAPYQTKWTIGLHGEVVKLASGKARTFDYRVAKFVRVQDPRSQKWNSPKPLRAGTYTVTAVYEQKTNELVYGVDAGPGKPFASEKRTYAGLWTGTIAAAPKKLVVTPPRFTTLTLGSPYELVPGRPFEVAFELRNGSDEPCVFDGTLEVVASSKAYGSGSLTVSVPGATAAKPMTLAAGQVITWTLDLAAQKFEPGHRAKRRNPEAAPLTSILPNRGIFLLQARIGDTERPPHVLSNELWRMRTDR